MKEDIKELRTFLSDLTKQKGVSKEWRIKQFTTFQSLLDSNEDMKFDINRQSEIIASLKLENKELHSRLEKIAGLLDCHMNSIFSNTPVVLEAYRIAKGEEIE